jgi:hypothetical protein
LVLVALRFVFVDMVIAFFTIIPPSTIFEDDTHHDS